MQESEQVTEEANYSCVRMKLISYNFGMQQEMLTSTKQWNKHTRNLCRVLSKFGEGSKGDIICGCEMGGHEKGFAASAADLGNVVKVALPGAKKETQGAYAVVYTKIVELLQSGVKKYLSEVRVEMHWTIFKLSVPDASQLAEVPIYIIVGNLHVRIPHSKNVSIQTRKNLTKMALDDLSLLGLEYGNGAVVVRVLCGDVNLQREGGRAATQGCLRACSGKFSQTGPLAKWECLGTKADRVGDIVFVNGAIAEECTIPVGRSFPDERGVRDDDHDAVGIKLYIPIRTNPRSGSQPAPPVADSGHVPSAAQPAEIPLTVGMPPSRAPSLLGPPNQSLSPHVNIGGQLGDPAAMSPAAVAAATIPAQEAQAAQHVPASAAQPAASADHSGQPSDMPLVTSATQPDASSDAGSMAHQPAPLQAHQAAAAAIPAHEVQAAQHVPASAAQPAASADDSGQPSELPHLASATQPAASSDTGSVTP